MRIDSAHLCKGIVVRVEMVPTREALPVVGIHTEVGIPVIVAGSPGDIRTERHEKVKNCPGEDDDVVDVHPAGHDSCCVTDT